jgi:7-cyano-7-deazaguanine reductase
MKAHSSVAKKTSLTQLGRSVAIPASPEDAVLEAVPNPYPGTEYVVRFTAPEFTTLCPVTGQPDFAHFVIDYCPAKSILESKSLKLFLASFRNQSGFHEACTLQIGQRLAKAVKPKFIRIAGYWYPRGGIPIDIFWQTGKVPGGVWLPETGVQPYRGRG